MALSPAGVISITTIRLVCTSAEDSSVGTGFLYEFPVGAMGRPNDVVLAIVTNKHVVEGADQVDLTVTWLPPDSELGDDTLTDATDHQHFTLTDLKQRLIPHPDDDVDVCLILVGDFYNNVAKGRRQRGVAIGRWTHLTDDERQAARPIESLLMIGYPNGLWDEQNNLPLVRRGLSASHILKRWNGRRLFMIDAACFPGSSGSPVFLYEDGMVRTNQDTYEPGSKARFVGILFAGPTIDLEGELVEREIPTGTAQVPVFQNMMNLGYVAHADTLDDFAPLIRAKLIQEQAARMQTQWTIPRAS